jgi:putative restriction endonuclease
MNNLVLNSCLSKLNSLNRANTLYCKAPLKSILFTELIKKGFTQNKRIYLNTDLLGTFQHNWLLLVNTLNQPDFIQPIYTICNNSNLTSPR